MCASLEKGVAQSSAEGSTHPVPDSGMEQVSDKQSLSAGVIHCVCSLVYRLMGRVKEVKDSTAGTDNSYYASLLNSKNEVSSKYTHGTHGTVCLWSTELSSETNFTGSAPHTT